MKIKQAPSVSTEFEKQKSIRFLSVGGALFLLLLLILIWGGTSYYSSEREQFLKNNSLLLKATSEEKLESIRFWRQERTNDAKFLAGQPNLQSLVITNDPAQIESNDDEEVIFAFGHSSELYNYSNIQLLDSNQNIIYQNEEKHDHLTFENLKLVTQAMKTRRVVISEVLASEDESHFAILVICPILTPHNEVLGTVVLSADPNDYLFPQLDKLTNEYASIESFLIKEANGDAVLLSPLRDNSAPVLSVLATANETKLPAIKAINGTIGFVQGIDYAGYEVMADVRPVPDSNWYIVTKANTNEMLADFYFRMKVFGVAAILLIFLMAGLGFNIYTNGLRRSYKDLYLAEAQATKAQTELASAVNAITEGFITCDPAGSVTAINPTAEQLTGINEEIAIGKPLTQVFQLEDEVDLLRHPKASESGKVMGEGLLIPAGKPSISVEYALTPVLANDSTLIGYVLIFKDLTESIQTRQQITDSNKRYSALFEFSPDAILLLAMPSGKIVQTNAGFTELTQYKPAEIIGKRTVEFDLWANPEKELERRKIPGFNNEVKNYETSIHCKDGSSRIVFVTAKNILLNNEANLLIAFSDITEMRASETREKQQELLTRTIFDTAPFGIWARDPERKLVIENKYVIDLYGSHLTETLAQADNPNLPLKHWMQLDEAAFRGEYSEYEEEITLPNGERFFAQKITTPMIQDGEIKGIMGFVIDITPRKMAEIELEKEKEELKRSNADLEQFAYVASHDLQEPLRMVSSYLQLIERRYKGKLDAKGDEFIAFAVEGASTMQRQILDLLMYSRVGLRTPENAECESQHALDTALTHLKFRIEETQAVITHDALPRVMADETQLTQVFQNIVGNAIKFVEGKPPLVHIGCQVEPEFWHFTVKDNGIGLEPRYTDRIFVIFQRLHEKNTYPGTGIGLAICKKIINRSGGKIWVESEVGVGSTFHFTLPRKAETNNE